MAHPKFHTYPEKVRAAILRADAKATAAQVEAGTARVGKLYVHGVEISIEKPKGSTRSGTGADGKTWTRKLTASYGYINRTTGDDGEHVDVFLGEHPESQLVFLMHQLDANGEHDECKVVVFCRNVTEAKETYLSNYPEGWADERLGEVRGLTFEQFRLWLKKHCPYKPAKKKAASDDSWISTILMMGSPVGAS